MESIGGWTAGSGEASQAAAAGFGSAPVGLEAGAQSLVAVSWPVVNPVPARRVGMVHRRTMSESPRIQHLAGLLRGIASKQ
jgi:hypothetical protein